MGYECFGPHLNCHYSIRCQVRPAVGSVGGTILLVQPYLKLHEHIYVLYMIVKIVNYMNIYGLRRNLGGSNG